MACKTCTVMHHLHTHTPSRHYTSLAPRAPQLRVGPERHQTSGSVSESAQQDPTPGKVCFSLGVFLDPNSDPLLTSRASESASRNTRKRHSCDVWGPSGPTRIRGPNLARLLFFLAAHLTGFFGKKKADCFFFRDFFEIFWVTGSCGPTREVIARSRVFLCRLACAEASGTCRLSHAATQGT
jgi:hypothetical protein